MTAVCNAVLLDRTDFRYRFVIPITNGTALESTAMERRSARKKLWILRALLNPLVSRVDVDDKK